MVALVEELQTGKERSQPESLSPLIKQSSTLGIVGGVNLLKQPATRALPGAAGNCQTVD